MEFNAPECGSCRELRVDKRNLENSLWEERKKCQELRTRLAFRQQDLENEQQYAERMKKRWLKALADRDRIELDYFTKARERTENRL